MSSAPDLATAFAAALKDMDNVQPEDRASFLEMGLRVRGFAIYRRADIDEVRAALEQSDAVNRVARAWIAGTP